jgi:hypothetical protein
MGKLKADIEGLNVVWIFGSFQIGYHHYKINMLN